MIDLFVVKLHLKKCRFPFGRSTLDQHQDFPRDKPSRLDVNGYLAKGLVVDQLIIDGVLIFPKRR